MPKALPKMVDRSVTAFLTAGLFLTILQLCLYFRPGPFGHPFVMDVSHYLGHAMFYGWYGLALVCLPFFLMLVLAHYRRFELGTWFLCLQLGVLLFSLVASHVDHELQRYMGTHLSVDWVRTYGRLGHTPGVIGAALADDLGGANFPLVLLGFTGLFPFVAWLLGQWIRYPRTPRSIRVLLASGVLVFFILPYLFWTVIPGGSIRRDKVKPPILLLSDNLKDMLKPKREFPNLKQSVMDYQAWWTQADPTKSWEFLTPDYPLLRTYVGPTPDLKDPPPNIIFLQLETYRAWSMSLYNEREKAEAAPYITEMARSAKGAWWQQSVCNGIPTIYATMSLHMSLLPHSQRRISTSFTNSDIDGFPIFLGRKGYQTELFTGSDPDWDNQRYWYNRWYDKVHFDPGTDEKDRTVFRDAAKRIREMGEKGPFLATVISITNHSPFRSPEPALNLNDSQEAPQRILNTMRYTDDVVREFIEGLKKEPWFERTVVIITGDHAYDLGDRGVMIGHRNLRHESIWVPIIIWGADDRIPRGKQAQVASHMDIGPTILELAGVYEPNSFMGHSLLHPDPRHAAAITIRTANMAVETQAYSVYFPAAGEPMLYAASDLLQQRNIAAEHPKVIQRLKRLGEAASELTDYSIEHNRLIQDK